MALPIILPLIFIAVFVFMALNVLKEYERGVLFTVGRLGGLREVLLGQRERLGGIRGPGLVFIIPFVQKLVVVDQRTVTMDILPQDVITKDNVSIKVNAVLYFRVMDPARAIVQVVNYLNATSQLAQTTLRSVCGEAELDDLLSQRDELNKRIQEIIDHQTDPWGIKVTMVEIKDIDLPQEMQRAMAKQAEAERERRAKIIQAEGEFQAAEKLTAAAQIMSQSSGTMQLRYLETLRHIASEHNSTILFPVPIELLGSFMAKKQ